MKAGRKPLRAAPAEAGRALASRAPTRLPRGEREASILEAAAAWMADRGFAGTTRELAARLGVTQALLYRYFPSKQALMDRVLDSRFGGDRWNADWTALLSDRSRPLEERLVAFYEQYRRRSSATGTRLWVRANLEGEQVAGRYSGALTRRLLAPIIRELRHHAGLRDFSSRGFMRGERELAMMLHGALVFIGIRAHVYRMPMAENLDDFVGLYVRAWLPGAVEELRRLHAPGAHAALTIRVAFSDDPGAAAKEARAADSLLKASRRRPTS